jgi:DNA-binding transcriptional regulator YdaS (Cro superfamily)
MKLAEYFQSEGRGSAARLANAISAFTSDVSDWAKGNRPVPIKYCAAIEQATSGKVTRKELCPDDWQAIWPELVKRSKKPAEQVSPVSVS